MHVCEVTSVASDSVAPWTVAHQALLSMGFSRQEYWTGYPFTSPGDLPNPGIEPASPGSLSLFNTIGEIPQIVNIIVRFPNLNNSHGGRVW